MYVRVSVLVSVGGDGTCVYSCAVPALKVEQRLSPYCVTKEQNGPLLPDLIGVHVLPADGRGSWFDRNLQRFSLLWPLAARVWQSRTLGQSCTLEMSSTVRGRLFFAEMVECHSRTSR